MVPASQGLSEEELAELHPFRMAEQDDWGSVNQEIPYEVPALSEQAARIWVHDRLTNQHLAVILNEEGLLSGVSSAQVQEEAHKLFMLPVYIGAFQFRERPWRFVINAQTGEVVGDPPVDWKSLFVGGCCFWWSLLRCFRWSAQLGPLWGPKTRVDTRCILIVCGLHSDDGCLDVGTPSFFDCPAGWPLRYLTALGAFDAVG